MVYLSGQCRSSALFSQRLLPHLVLQRHTAHGKDQKRGNALTDQADCNRITSVYISAVTIAFMICGANSDLFGRRWFILGGNIFVFVGAIVGATSHSIGQSIVAHVLIGFGAGNCQLATFALPELLPNKWRHIGVVIADGVAFFPVIAGPVTARVAIRHGDSVSTPIPSWP